MRIENAMEYLPFGSIQLAGYPEDMIDFTIEHQFLDASLWSLLVNQFRLHSDTNGEWRGEYWGKLMRGACLTYQVKEDPRLYQVLRTSVLDLLSTQDTDGRLSSYPRGKDLYGWDVWGRKYAAIGLLSFYEICSDPILKEKILLSVEAEFDDLLSRLGPGKKDLLDTSELYGAMNSASLINPILTMYRLTGKEKYRAFAEHIVKEGMCKGFNLFQACLDNKLYPYEFKEQKAYEEMSCIEGLISFYQITKEPSYLKASENFVKKVLESDYTIIGSCGCKSEFFDHSTETQTHYVEGALQETCVTVTLMGLCSKLLLITGNAIYANAMERSTYNALYGAVNNEDQKMRWIKGAWIRKDDEFIDVPHGGYPFDSYSPLYRYSRGRQIGGFQLLQDGKSYGCCTCNGGRGTALVGREAILRFGTGFAVNFYQNLQVEEEGVRLTIKANLYRSGHVQIRVEGQGRNFPLALRLPEWSKNPTLTLDGVVQKAQEEKGYLVLNEKWDGQTIDLDFPFALMAHVKNGKVAFSRGPIVLARDHRFQDMDLVLPRYSENEKIPANPISNSLFSTNLTLEIQTKKGPIRLCDYSQAGKDYDDKDSLVSVWQDME